MSNNFFGIRNGININPATLPVSGNLGDIAVDAAGVSYIWDGSVWSQLSMPQQSNNIGKFLQTNGTTAQWSNLPRNIIINGDMRIDQRGAGSSVVTADNTYHLDRWVTSQVTAGALTAQRVTSSIPSGFTHALKITVTTADVSIASGDLFSISQRIEGFNCSSLDFGKAAAKTVTLSFWVRSSKTGIYTGALVNSAANRSLTFEYTISVADTWEKIYITLSGDTTGTWLVDNGIGLRVYFTLMSGSTYQQTSGTWGASAAVSTSNQVNWMDTISATFYITGIQLEIGSVATDFEYKSIDKIISECQRYYQKSYQLELAPGAISGNGPLEGRASSINTGAGYAWLTARFNTYMRDTPVITPYSDVTGASGKLRDIDGGADVDATGSSEGMSGTSITNNAAMAGTGRRIRAHYVANAEL